MKWPLSEHAKTEKNQEDGTCFFQIEVQEMVQKIGFFLQTWQWWIMALGGAGIGASLLLAASSERRSVWLRLAAASFILMAGAASFWNFVVAASFQVPRWGLTHAGVAAFLAVAAAIATNSLIRLIRPALNRAADAATLKTGLERNKKTDVRKIHELLPAVAAAFDPVKFWRSGKTFLGLGAGGKPVEAPERFPHMLVLGTTGAGKGVVLSQVAAQAMARGEAVFFLDPKNDEWAASVLARVAARAEKKFHFVDLRPGAGPQLNPLAGADEHQIFELFSAGFSLGEKGTDADFYRLKDRQAAKRAAQTCAAENLTAAQLLSKMDGQLDDAPAFAGYLQEMSELPAVNAGKGGLDLAEIVREGGAVFFVGSMRNSAVIRMQRMLLVRLIQLAEARDRTQEQRQVLVVLDEFKFHVSRPAVEALGAARDKGVHLVLAAQSLGDLRDTPADLDKDAVVQAVTENTPVKIVYRLEDPRTAQVLAEKSGRIQADDEVRKIKRGAGMVEIVDDERQIRQTETFLVDQNQLLNLRSRQAVVFGLGLPQFISTSHISCEKQDLQPQVVAGFQPKTIEINID